jgi:hypothetical protein
MEWINENSGLLSLVAAIAAVAGIFVPFIIRWLDKKEKRQELLEEYDIRKSMDIFPMSHEEREFYAQREILKNKLKKIKKLDKE